MRREHRRKAVEPDLLFRKIAERHAILVVDDEPQVLRAIRDALEEEFDVYTETSPVVALGMLKDTPQLSVIMSDQRMPQMGGDEFLAEANRLSPATRMLITGYADIEAVVRAVNMGRIFGYVAKPWNSDYLKLAVHKAVEHFILLRSLSTERDFMSSLMENVPDAIFFKDTRGRYVRINAAKAYQLGLASREDAIGETAAKFNPRDKAELIAQEDREILASGVAQNDILEKAVGSDGTERWFSTTKAPIHNVRGRITGLVGITRDITSRKRLEEVLQEREAALRHAQQMAKIGHFVWKPRTREITGWSDTALKLLGNGEAAMPSTVDSWMDRIHIDDQVRVREAHEAAVRSVRPLELEFRMMRSNGEWIVVSEYAEQLMEAGGADRSQDWFITVQDITRRKRAENELRLVLEIGRSIGSAPDIDHALGLVLRQICETTGWDYGEAWLPNESTDVLCCSPQWHGDRQRLAEFRAVTEGLCLAAGQGMHGRVAKTGRPEWWPDVSNLDPITFQRAEIARKIGLKAGLSVPISDASGTTIAVLTFLMFHVRGEDQNQVELVVGIARQLGEFLQRKVAAIELMAREEKFSLLLNSAVEAIYGIDLKGNCTFINPACLRVLGYDTPGELLGRNMHVMVHHSRHDGSPYPDNECPIYATIQGVVGTHSDSEVFWRRDGGSFPVEYWSYPLRRGGETIGAVVTFFDITERRAQADRIARLTRTHAMLSGINSTIVRVESKEALFAEACRLAVETGGFQRVCLRIADAARTTLVPVGAAGTGLLQTLSIDLAEEADPVIRATTAYRAFHEGRTQVFNDLRSDVLPAALRGRAAKLGYLSIVSLPLLSGGAAVGVLTLAAAVADCFDAEEIRLLEELADDIAFAVQTLENKERLDFLAQHDPLTGIFNRSGFLNRIQQRIEVMRETEKRVAIVAMNLNRFRSINETLGLDAGDQVLREVAQRLREVIGGGNVARISADGFGALVGTAGPDETADVIHRLQYAMAAPCEIAGRLMHVSARFGVALYPSDGETAEALSANAEAALQQARGSGEEVVFYETRLNARVAERLELENRLRLAIAKDEFVLYYQPKVDSQTRRIAGVEALIRWQNPELGLIPPDKFIPVMEETGLILQVGSWALGKAAEDHARWKALGIAAPRVAVNVSAIQLRRSEFVQTVETALKRGGSSPALDLEITESLVMEDVEGNMRKLREIRAMGVGIAVDDFGTGYSSLGYLAKLPVETLKIDRSFVITMLEDADTMALVSTIISLAHSLRLNVVAEGVDHDDQAKMLRLLRCEQMQGYLFSKPVPFEEMTELLWREQGSCLGHDAPRENGDKSAGSKETS